MILLGLLLTTETTRLWWRIKGITEFRSLMRKGPSFGLLGRRAISMVDCLTQMALPLIKKEIILSRVVVAFRFLILLASFLRKFGSEGEGNGQFNPLGVGVLANGNVVVGDYLRAKCQIFDSVGNFVREFGAGILIFPNHLFYGLGRQHFGCK